MFDSLIGIVRVSLSLDVSPNFILPGFSNSRAGGDPNSCRPPSGCALVLPGRTLRPPGVVRDSSVARIVVLSLLLWPSRPARVVSTGRGARVVGRPSDSCRSKKVGVFGVFGVFDVIKKLRPRRSIVPWSRSSANARSIVRAERKQSWDNCATLNVTRPLNACAIRLRSTVSARVERGACTTCAVVLP